MRLKRKQYLINNHYSEIKSPDLYIIIKEKEDR